MDGTLRAEDCGRVGRWRGARADWCPVNGTLGNGRARRMSTPLHIRSINNGVFVWALPQIGATEHINDDELRLVFLPRGTDIPEAG